MIPGYIKIFNKTDLEKETLMNKKRRKRINTQSISNCDTTTDWLINNGIGITLGNDTSDKIEGTGSLYNSVVGTAAANGYVIYEYNPTIKINLAEKEFIDFWIKSSLAGTMYCHIDDGILEKDWDDFSRFRCAANTWTKFTLPILASAGTYGLDPNVSTGKLNLINIDRIQIGIGNVGALAICTLHIDNVTAWAEV